MITTLGYLQYAQRKNAMEFDRLSFLVFDEADELFDENFKNEIENFMNWAGQWLTLHVTCNIFIVLITVDTSVAKYTPYRVSVCHFFQKLSTS